MVSYQAQFIITLESHKGRCSSKLFINDLPDRLKHAVINLFADDTLLFIHGSGVHELKRLRNEEC